MASESQRKRNERYLGAFETIKRPVIVSLLFLMLVVVLVATIDIVLAVIALIASSFTSGNLLSTRVSEEQFLELFGAILTIFVALELAESVEVYLHENRFHVGPVLLVALVAVARKVILVDYKTYPPLAILALAAITIALAMSYWLISGKRGENDIRRREDDSITE